ncbi:hypothetical protein V497_03660 [Pseudogymnoascus sp. VKM F-4516 (FW-969)]|nr:hypothetical protein V497_03660 [Pseudogymnoascus sp. VKM F-4516 (FW-969)]
MPLLATPLPSPERTTHADSLSKTSSMSSQTPMLPALPPRSSLRASRLFEFSDLSALTALSPPPRATPTTKPPSPSSTPELSPSNPYETYLSSASSEEDEDESDGSTSDSDAECEPAYIAEAIVSSPIKTTIPEPSSEQPQTHYRHSSQPDVARAVELVAVGPATLIVIPQPRPFTAPDHPRRASTTSTLASRSSLLPPSSTTNSTSTSARRPTPLRISTAPAPRFPSLFPSVSTPSLPFLETDPFSASSPGMTASPAPLSPALSTTSTSRDGIKQRLNDVRRGLAKGAEAAAAAAAKGRRRPSMGRMGFGGSGWKGEDEQQIRNSTPVSALQQEELAASMSGRRGSDTTSIHSTRSARRAETPPQPTPLSQRSNTHPHPQAYQRPVSQRPPSQMSQRGEQAPVRYEDIMRAAKERAKTAPEYAPPPPPTPQDEKEASSPPKLGRRKSGVFGAMGMGMGRRKSIRL